MNDAIDGFSNDALQAICDALNNSSSAVGAGMTPELDTQYFMVCKQVDYTAIAVYIFSDHRSEVLLVEQPSREARKQVATFLEDLGARFRAVGHSDLAVKAAIRQLAVA